MVSGKILLTVYRIPQSVESVKTIRLALGRTKKRKKVKAAASSA